MSIQKKSLISTLKTTKKANVASAPATNEGVSTRKVARKIEVGKMLKAKRFARVS